MDNKIKRFQKAYILFTIAQLFIILGLFSYGTQIKALSDWLYIFTIIELVGHVLIIIASTMLFRYNNNYFLFFITSIVSLFINIIAIVGLESTEDLTVAWARGLAISGDILLCLIYVYFFMGTRDYFVENGLTGNVKRSKMGYIFIIVSTIVRNIISFVRTFSIVKTNYIASAVLRYGSLLIEFITYTFIFVVLMIMIVHMQKKRKESALLDEKE